MIEIKTIDWQTILFQWKFNLWPGRYDYKEMSSMVFNERDNYDMDIYTKYNPTFWGAYCGSTIVGVNSGFRTEDNLYRSRGIWVSSAFRKKGIAQQLFAALEEQAIAEGCDKIWSYPREGSHIAYTKYGFKIASEWHNDSFGRNVYVLKQLKLSK